MKTLSVCFLFIICFSLFGFSQNQFSKISDEKLNNEELNQVSTLAKKLLEGQKSGNFYLLHENEASPEMVKGLTAQIQENSYENIKSQFGDYRSLEFAEAWNLNAGEEYTIYRFKGDFSETEDKPEIRLVVNSSGLIAGFWIREWKDDISGQP